MLIGKLTGENRAYQGLLLAALLAFMVPGVKAEDPGYEFTFQGELLDDGAPFTGACDFEFTLWDADLAGTQIGVAEARVLTVTDGKFTTDLDFSSGAGGAFNGEARWIELGVCCESPCAPGYTTLDPRQRVTPAPYALALPGFYTIQDETSPNVIGGSRSNVVFDGVIGATISGGGMTGDIFKNQVWDDYGTVSGGSFNSAGNDDGSTTTARGATVGGGFANVAFGWNSTVAGGSNNLARAYASTSGGGNNCDVLGQYATTPGGESNLAGGDWSFAGGRYATVRHADPGWPSPEYSGDSDGDEGTFVWADSTHSSGNRFISTGPNQFLISAAGGVGIGTNAPGGAMTVNATGHGVAGLELERDELTYADTKSRMGISSVDGALGLRLQMSADDGANWADALFASETGDVGIGTTAPAVPLHVGGGSDAGIAGGGLHVLGDIAGQNIVLDDNEIMARDNGATSRLNLNADGGDVAFFSNGSGRVGIGTATPVAMLQLVGGDDAQIIVGDAPQMVLRRNVANNKFDILLGGTNYTGKYLQIGRDDQTHDISLMGDVGVGTTSPTAKLEVEGSLKVDTNTLYVNPTSNRVGINTTAPSEALHVVGNACVTGTVGSCSDRRYKKDIRRIVDAPSVLSRLRGVHFNWRGSEFPDRHFSNESQIGFIAQEVEKVLPEVVLKGGDGYYAVDYGRLTPVLVEAIKVQTEQISNQADEIKTLKQNLERLERAIATLQTTEVK